MDPVQGGQPSRPIYIHELNDWPDFRWNEELIKQPLGLVSRLQKQIVADAANMGTTKATETTVRNLTNSAVASSRIEEEYPDPKRRTKPPSGGASWLYHPGNNQWRTGRTWHRCRNGRHGHQPQRTTDGGAPPISGTVCCSQARIVPTSRLDDGATTGWAECALYLAAQLDEPSSTSWHPPLTGSKTRWTAFLQWFNRTEPEPDIRKAAISHLWFVTIHPYDDGNGRITRAITDLALSRCDGTDTRLYSMSGEIMRQRSRYYRALQVTQSGSMNITAWMLWFFDCLTEAMIQG